MVCLANRVFLVNINKMEKNRKQKILVIGSTGRVGYEIVQKALNERYNVRCLIRTKNIPIKASISRSNKIEFIYGDLTRPETLTRCVSGITAIIDASTVRFEENVEFIDWYSKIALLEAAKLAGVEHFIFFSKTHAKKYSMMPMMKFKSQFEEVLQNSGVNYTIFQIPNVFQKFIPEFLRCTIDEQVINIYKKFRHISSMDARDIATFSIKSLQIKEAQNQTFILGQPQNCNLIDIIQKCASWHEKERQAISRQWEIESLTLIGQFLTWIRLFQNATQLLAYLDIFYESWEQSDINFANLESIFSIKSDQLININKYFTEYLSDDFMIEILEDYMRF